MVRTAWVLGVLVCCVALLASPAAAWEFSMTSEMDWNYYSETQMGTQGFFGPYNVDNAAGPLNFGGSNFWGGVNKLVAPGPGGPAPAWGAVYSGSNAVRQTTKMEICPEFRINKAIRIRGAYRIGSWAGVPANVSLAGLLALAPGAQNEAGSGVPSFNTGTTANVQNSELDAGTQPGTRVSFSPGYWNQLWLTAQTPWGIFAFGKRPFTFGIGTITNGEDNTTTDSLLLSVPYGPLTFLGAFYAHEDSTYADLDVLLPRKASQNFDGSDLWYYGSPAAAVVYNSGSLSAGMLYRNLSWRVGPESRQVALSPFTGRQYSTDFIPRDYTNNLFIAFMKYANCNFFLNAEVDVWRGARQNQLNGASLGTGPAAGAGEFGELPFVSGVSGGGSLFRPTYTEYERYAVETGAMVGPAKLTLMGARIPGMDRRAGVFIDRQSSFSLGAENASLILGPAAGLVQALGNHPNLTNAGFFLPYSWLMVYNYGAGEGNSLGPGGANVTWNGDGTLNNANALAARLDYAVAANLNVWGSAFYAERVNHAWGWGHISPNPAGDGSQFSVDGNYLLAGQNSQGHYNPAGAALVSSPAIPDRSLGYEFGGGVDWQLLQGLKFNGRASYWMPGKWFSYACVSRSNPFWKSPGTDPTGLWGTAPNRTIDPVLGFQCQIVGEF